MSKQTKTSNPDAEIAELVTKHISNLDDKGKLQLPGDMPIWQKQVIRSEKRTRDAQAELSKTQTTLRAAEASNSVLSEQVLSIVPDSFQLNDAEIQELNLLKVNDPDAYRLRVNDLEAKAVTAQRENIKSLTDSAVTQANETFIAKDRITVLQEFKAANPDTVITDDVLVNDVPPRFMNDLNAGKYDYHTYLTKVAAYLGTGKVLHGQGQGEQHNLSSLSGSQTPGKIAAENAGKTDYKKITF